MAEKYGVHFPAAHAAMSAPEALPQLALS
jgi:hypothetical protein